MKTSIETLEWIAIKGRNTDVPSESLIELLDELIYMRIVELDVVNVFEFANDEILCELQTYRNGMRENEARRAYDDLELERRYLNRSDEQGG